MSKLLEEMRDLIRTLHYTYRSEEACLHWIGQYILFPGKRHPTEMELAEVSAFLTHLAVKRQVAASTQNQALAPLLFLYKNVLNEELPWLKNVERAKRPSRIPLVLTRAEVKRLLKQLGNRTGSNRVCFTQTTDEQVRDLLAQAAALNNESKNFVHSR